MGVSSCGIDLATVEKVNYNEEATIRPLLCTLNAWRTVHLADPDSSPTIVCNFVMDKPESKITHQALEGVP